MSVVVLDYNRIPSSVAIWLPTDHEKRIIAVDPNKGWPYWVRMEDGTLRACEDADGLLKLLGAVWFEGQWERIKRYIEKIADLLDSPHEIRIQLNGDDEHFSVQEPSGEIPSGGIRTLRELTELLSNLPEWSPKR